MKFCGINFMRRDNQSHTALFTLDLQVRHPAMIVRQPYTIILSIRSVHDDTRSRVSLIGKLGRSSRYKILMRRARRDIKFARLGKILIRHGDGKFQSDAPIEGTRKF